ncbi:FAD-dependent monooxygenase [Mobilicoccus massiliensis]|uniref:FAD-dependent monooxygenase n=1 Tax=Mobilicoccus massiliensis TaxID=1522310 RepID=UPI000693225B|nr:NAD(P)/FAD-dependent oxidoreductase [Mobilicoccus massiliensis]
MPTITIVGGGVAGLALAATLDPADFDVTLIERNPGFGRVPTAFGIWPFALAALERIGLDGEVRRAGLPLTSGVISAGSTHRPVTMTSRSPGLWLLPRPSLLRVLDEAVPVGVVRERREVDDPTALDGDLVVAADGVRSVVRRRIWGDEPRDTGVVAVRGVLPTAPDGPQDRICEFWGDGALFGVGPNRLPEGIGTNWYASARRREESPEASLSWAREAFADFPEPVRATLGGADPMRTVVNTILESRHPRRLVRDRYVLVGDAAHAMSPNLGRGACEAMVDAITLGLALNEHGRDGLRRYERSRLRPGQRMRAASALARRIALSDRAGRVVVGAVGALGRHLPR